MSTETDRRRELALLDAGLLAILNDPKDYRTGVSRALRGLAESAARENLSEIDVGELKRYKPGIRVAVLRKGGFETIGEILGATTGKLSRLDGISDDGAREIKKYARQIQDEARSFARVKLTPDARTPEQTALVRAIFELRMSEKLRERAGELYDGTHADIEQALEEARRNAGARGWLASLSRAFRGERGGPAAETPGIAEAYLAGEYGERARKLIAAHRDLTRVSESVVWSDFERHSAQYYALLEEFDEGTVDRTTGTQGLPAPLASRVEEVPLDLSGLRSRLRRYQIFGVKYAVEQKAVLLGDEMGLGKTVEAIALMCALRARGGTHFLVVCPASVLVNWLREIEKHSDLAAMEIHGSDRADELSSWIEGGGAAVTTYETVSRLVLPGEEAGGSTGVFPEDFRIDALIVDEAHYVKNPEAIRTRAVVSLRERSEHVLFLTGTPLENRVEEMGFLIRTLQPEIAERVQGMQALARAPQFRETVAPVYFRRTREDVLTELPEKVESEEWCTMTRAERLRYYSDTFDRNFMAMRQLSWNVEDLRESSKAARLSELCAEAREDGRKVLVFSFFRNTLSRVAELLGESCAGVITGSVPPARRQELIDAFEEAEAGSVLVAQVQAGGVGLNIQSASVVIFCEPQIKPSIETQAISRAYRMGQVRSVLVYRLLCAGSVDERILELLAEKQNLFDHFAEESVAGEESLRLADSLEGAIIEAEIERITRERQTENLP